MLEAFLSEQFGDLSTEQSKVISEIHESNKDLLFLIQKLLEVYRYEAGTQNLQFRILDIKFLISRCAQDLSARYDYRNPIVINLPDYLPKVPGDEDALRRLFTNILDNSIKYSGAGSAVTIHTVQAGTKLAVHIHNSGPAIPADVQRKLFQSPWQGVPGESYVAHTGLGLYLCHRIARLHDGKITCQSSAEEGTTFKVILPISI